jgi:hypothetical protein
MPFLPLAILVAIIVRATGGFRPDDGTAGQPSPIKRPPGGHPLSGGSAAGPAGSR